MILFNSIPAQAFFFFYKKFATKPIAKPLAFIVIAVKTDPIHSLLDTIPEIGLIKRARLLRHFGSVEKIKQASSEELRQVKGITQKDIDALAQFFQS